MSKFEIHVNETEGHKPAIKKSVKDNNDKKESNKVKKEGK